VNKLPKPAASVEFYPSLWDYIDGGPRARIVLAEGDPGLSHCLATGLRRSSHAVLATQNGDEAMNVLSSVAIGALPQPDAAILEMQLAIHSGLDCLGRFAEPAGPLRSFS
jgi:DNA-binding response OmpR family regulator